MVTASSPTWETLEAFARQSMQQFLQRTLEAEVDELLARGRYERRAALDAPVGYRNGFGKSRRLSLSNGTMESAARRGRRIVAVTHVDAVTARADQVLGISGSDTGSSAIWRGTVLEPLT